eukprot:scaffold4470_cov255-Prasinococcus_capsulatus_cf.AAC.33
MQVAMVTCEARRGTLRLSAAAAHTRALAASAGAQVAARAQLAPQRLQCLHNALVAARHDAELGVARTHIAACNHGTSNPAARGSKDARRLAVTAVALH